MKYDLAVYIGRFQPFHNGHKSVLDEALQIAERVAVVIGSDGGARTGRNPWTSKERIEMIRECYSPAEQQRIIFLPQQDHLYNFERWLSEVRKTVWGACNAKWSPDPRKIALMSYEKDQTSFYLKHFPTWETVEVTAERTINATDIRRLYFYVDDDKPYSENYDTLPDGTLRWLVSWQNTNAQTYNHIAAEWNFIEAYKKTWEAAPFPPTFVTVDAVVTQAAHILLVTRKSRPGMGLLALPGGFIDPGETLKESAIRELKEETRIKIPVSVLAGSIVAERTFDAPTRSERGRTITTAFHFRLNETELPKVKGGDDAASARWVPFSDLRRDQLYEDHFDIITTMLGI